MINAASAANEEDILETTELIQACDMEICDVWHQQLKEVKHLSYIGSGKVNEFAHKLKHFNVDCVIFQQALSSLQAGYLSEAWNIPVIDRSELIIDIFEQRAHTQEAKLQVRKAKMEKQQSRLIGKNKSLGRQGGGRNKGSGEKQLELNRRLLKQRIKECDRQIQNLKKQNSLHYEWRNKQQIPVVALIGYTNAGKSTILNALLKQSQAAAHKQVYAQDQLFATLDTSIRRISLPYAPDILMVDTVGFVSNLPHELIEAFHATLDEIRHADLLLHVIDHHSPLRHAQTEAALSTLKTLNTDFIPRMDVYNKCDLSNVTYPKINNNAIYMSANDPNSILLLSDQLAETLYGQKEAVTFRIPYENNNVLTAIRPFIQLKTQENHTSYTVFHGFMRKKLILSYMNYVKF